MLSTVRRKFLTRENIDEFDKFPAIRQYFPYQNFLYLPLMNGNPASLEEKLYQ